VTLTDRQLNRATLGRQMLLRRESMGVVEAVHRVVALQAQEAASPYLALWNRLKKFDPGDLDAAFVDRTIVKSSLMRVTLHAIDAEEYPAFHDAMQPSLRGARLNDDRFKRTGLSGADADALMPEIRRFVARPRTNAEIEAWIDERLGVLPKPSVWWALRHYGPFVHAPTGGPWSFGPRPTYRAADENHRAGDSTASLPVLIRRYVEGFGPASATDMKQFGGLTSMSLVRAALSSLIDAGVVERLEGADGTELYDVPGSLRPPDDSPAPARLLGMWDNVLLAYADRSRVIPPDYRRIVIRINGDVLPTLLVDGYVAGAWRPVENGIEATAFDKLPGDAWKALEAEARTLRAFLADREPLVYGRYGHWWRKKLPSAEVRVLGD
jgi:hypothetical protein